MIAYLTHTTILLSGLMIFYWLFLRNETFFALNRWTFVFCIFLSFTLPTISVPASISLQQKFQAIPQAFSDFSEPAKTAEASDISTNQEESAVASPNPAVIETYGPLSVQALRNWPLKSILFAIYIVGACIFLIVFIVQLLVLLTRKYNLNSVKTGKYSIVELVKEQEPYSFMNTIFINPQSYDQETYDQIIEHEKLHIDQAHFIDKLLAEFLVILFWFNPLVWMLRSSIGKNLEFLTDQTLLKKGMEKESYQMSLLKVSVSTKPFNLTTSYNNSFLKNRIIMMNSKKSSIASIWKYLFILPLFFLSMISLNAVQADQYSEDSAVELSNDQDQETVDKNAELSANEGPKAKQKSAKNQNLEAQNWIELPPSNPANTQNSKRELNLDKITGFNIANQANVFVELGSVQKITVEGPTHLLDKLNQEVKKGYWNIKIDDYQGNYKKDENISITMQVTELNSVAISGQGNIAGKGIFESPKNMNFAISGQGNIALDVKAENTNCAISGHGNIALKGSSNRVQIGISGDGNISTIGLKASQVNVAVSGSGKIAVNAEEKLTTSVSGHADIEYTGNPKLNQAASGHATVKRANG